MRSQALRTRRGMLRPLVSERRVHSQRRRADPRPGRDRERVRGVFQGSQGQAEAGDPIGCRPLSVRGHGRHRSHAAPENRRRRNRGVRPASHRSRPRRRPVESGHRPRMGSRGVGLDASFKELESLIGTWQAATKDRDVTITVRIRPRPQARRCDLQDCNLGGCSFDLLLAGL
jgi:hypothetical protein